MVLHNNRRSSGVKNQLFLYKNFNFRFIFLIVSNVIDSPEIVSSSKQSKYVTLEDCFISIPWYIILSFPAFLTFASNRKVCILSCLHQDEYLIYYLRTIHTSWRNTCLTDVRLYEHLHIGMLSLNRRYVKANRNERLGASH